MDILGDQRNGCIDQLLLSQLTLDRAITQVDNGTIADQDPGGKFAAATRIFNLLGGILFVLGVASMIAFVYMNMEIE
jgi:hypothetical protein